MQILDNLAFRQWFFQVLVVFFIIGGLAGIAVGVGLIVNSERMLALFQKLNHWTSMRRSLKPLELPRDSSPVVQRYMRVLAAVFVAGGLYTLYALLVSFSAEAIIFGLRLQTLPPLVTGLMIDVARWILVAGNLAAVAVGLLMFLSPATLTHLEERGSKWFSDRAITQVGDAMHTPIDRWVAASPRAAGIILAIGSLVVVVSAFYMLSVQR